MCFYNSFVLYKHSKFYINRDQQGPSCSVSESPEQFCGVHKFLATEEGVNPGSQAQQEIPESHWKAEDQPRTTTADPQMRESSGKCK